jgi:hypothetical protein
VTSGKGSGVDPYPDGPVGLGWYFINPYEAVLDVP